MAAIVDIRITGKRRSDIFHTSFNVNKQAIPTFNVLYLNNSKNVQFVQNDSSYIVVTTMKDSIIPQINYTIKEDTLWLTDFEKQIYRNVWISIHVANTLKNIQLKNSDISIIKFISEKLSLDLNKSSVSFNLDNSKSSAISILNIVAKNHSKINANGFKVDSLGIFLQHSEATLKIISKKISGTLSDSSKINVRQSEEISLKKDATSKIYVNDYY